jgi:hypothetical protein
MNLREEISYARSKAQMDTLAGWIGDDRARFKALVKLFQEEGEPLLQRAAWIISIVAAGHPALLEPHLAALVRRMEQPGLPAAVKRHVMGILQDVPVPESLHGRVMNAAFSLLEDPGEAIAVRVFSMSVLGNLSRIYPDIKGELRLIIEEILRQNPSAGIRARAKRVLKELGTD